MSREHDKSSRDDSPSFDSTKLVSDDGRVVGLMKVSKELATQINTLYPALLTYASEWGEKIVGPFAERLARQAGKSEAEVLRVGAHARDFTGYGIIFLKPTLEIMSNVWESGRKLNELSQALKPLGKEGWECETVKSVDARRSMVFTQNLARSATGIVGSFPAWYNKVSKQSLLNEERMKAAKWKAAQNDPEKLALLLEEEASLKAGMATPAQQRQAMELVLDRQEKAYRVEFYGTSKDAKDGFMHSAKANEIRKKVKDDLGKLPSSSDEFYEWSRLERYGIDVKSLKRRLLDAPETRVKADSTKGRYRDTPSRDDIWQDFTKQFQSKELKRIQEDEVKMAFARQKGGVILEYGWVNSGTEKMPTVREHHKKIIEERLQKVRDDEKTAKTEHAKKDHDPGHIGNLFAGVGAGLAGEWLGNVMGIEKHKDEITQPLAWDFIDALKKIQRKALDSGENLPASVELAEPLAASLRDSLRNRGEGSPHGDISYVVVLHEIVQRNAIANGHAPVHKHEFEHLEGADWDAKKIKGIPDEELTAYEMGLVRMAKLIETGELSAIAVNLLVSHKKYRFTDALTSGNKETQCKMINARIDAVMENYRLRDEVDEEKATQARGGIVITDAQIRQGFGANGALKGDERVFTFSLLQSLMQNKKELCKITGMSNDQCEQMGNVNTARFNQLLDAAVMEIAESIKNDPEGVEKQLKLTEDDRKLITDIAKRLEKAPDDTKPLAENREELKSVQTAVANAMLTAPAEPGHEPGFWQRVVERVRNPKPKVEAKEDEKTPAKDAMESGEDEEMGDEKPRYASKIREEGKRKDAGRDPYKGADSRRDDDKAAMRKKRDSAGDDLGYDEENEVNEPGEVDRPKPEYAKRVRGGDGASLASGKYPGRRGSETGSESFTPDGVSL